MISKLGNANFGLMVKMMDLHAAKQRVISQNIANVNTPYYRRRTFDFNEELRNALSRGDAESYDAVEGRIEKPNNTPVRNNGNNVDIDLEMVNMSQNSTSYQIYTQLYGKKMDMLRSAIKGV